MKIITVSNQKGGVGKTTSSISIAGHLCKRGYKVLMVDLDPQSSLTSYLGVDVSDRHVKTAYSLFSLNYITVDECIVATKIDNLSLIPSSDALATIDRVIGGKDGKGLILGKALEKCAFDYDYVVIDTPPVLGVLMINALSCCDKLIIPVQSEFLALKGLDRMVNTISMISAAMKRSLDYLIVPTMYDRRTKISERCLNSMVEKHGKHVWGVVIPVDTNFKIASSKGLPISHFAYKSRGSVSYDLLIESIIHVDERSIGNVGAA